MDIKKAEAIIDGLALESKKVTGIGDVTQNIKKVAEKINLCHNSLQKVVGQQEHIQGALETSLETYNETFKSIGSSHDETLKKILVDNNAATAHLQQLLATDFKVIKQTTEESLNRQEASYAASSKNLMESLTDHRNIIEEAFSNQGQLLKIGLDDLQEAMEKGDHKLHNTLATSVRSLDEAIGSRVDKLFSDLIVKLRAEHDAQVSLLLNKIEEQKAQLAGYEESARVSSKRHLWFHFLVLLSTIGAGATITAILKGMI